MGVSLNKVHAIRANVAAGIIYDAHVGHGKNADELMEEVTKHCIGVSFDDAEANHATIATKTTDLTADGDGNECVPFTRPKPLMPGAMTALDLCAKALLLKNATTPSSCQANGYDGGGSPPLNCIGTGSHAMDKLLAPDEAYSSFDAAWSMRNPYKIPNNDHASSSFDDNENEINPPSGHGIPFGMVTEFSGPPNSGKTQLSLSIAARAAFSDQLDVHYIAGGASRGALTRRLHSLCLELARDATMARWGLTSDGELTTEMGREVKNAALAALERVRLCSVPDAYSLLGMLARIDGKETRRTTGVDNSTKREVCGALLVVDSVSGCLGHHLSGDEAGSAWANQVALTLRRMARTHDGRLSGSTPSSAPSSSGTPQPCRFAVVVTNGSVAQRPSDKDYAASTKPFKNKPAMGRYWHASDVGVWLEADNGFQCGDAETHSMNFYNDTHVLGLAKAKKGVIVATLQNHHGKSCRPTSGPSTVARFRIGSGGIVDV